MAHFLKVITVAICLMLETDARDLGVQGHVFPIAEEDLLKYLQKKFQGLSPDQVSKIQQHIKKHYLALAHEPKAVEQIKDTQVYRSHFFDPTVIVPKDIKDHEGRILVAKGTRVNPLNTHPLSEPLLFLDGTQTSHIEWAKQQGQTKWILVKGKPLVLEAKEKLPIYFDQFGRLTHKLKIKHVPAKVTQEGLQLKIEEIPLEDM